MGRGNSIQSDNYVRDILQTTTDPIPSIRQFPRSVMRALGDIASQQPFRIADAGQPYNATDAILDPKLPFRRLIFATKSSKHFLVCYMRGGFASAVCIVAFATDTKDSARPVLIATMWTPCESLKQLQKAFEQHDLNQYRPTSMDF